MSILALCALTLSALPAAAQDAPPDAYDAAPPPAGPDWQPTGLSVRSGTLFAPTSGALLATTADGLMRSDDAGLTWRSIPLPAPKARVAVDPTNHSIVYAFTPDILYKTSDDAHSWQPVLVGADQFPTSIKAVVISPIDDQVVYARLGWSDRAVEATVLRSRDGGQTWTKLHTDFLNNEFKYASPCNVQNGAFLATDPVSANTVYLSQACVSSHTRFVAVHKSLDQGDTWIGAPFDGAWGAWLFPNLGCAGMVVSTSSALGPGWPLMRQEADCHTWHEVSYPTGSGHPLPLAVAADTNRLYVALDPCCDGGDAKQVLLATADDGATWTPLGQTDIGDVRDLVVGVDGRNLYAATDQGVFVLSLDQPATAPPDAGEDSPD